MNILIIEDEPLVALSLSRVLREIEPGVLLDGPLPSVKASKAWLAAHPEPDLILADIQLSDGISFDIFAEYANSCPVIFTTAYNEYAIRAFKVNSIDYLLKPIDRKELEKAFYKFHQLQSKYRHGEYLLQMRELLANFAQSRKYKERFTVHQGKSVAMFPQQEVVGFVKEEIIYLLHANGKRFITDYRSLDEVEELLNPVHFFRANRQHIIQLAFVDNMRTDEWGKLTVKMRGERQEEILVSKEKAAEFRRWFGGVGSR